MNGHIVRRDVERAGGGEVSDLTDFLLARIAEDEAMARAATVGPWWHDPTKWNAIDHEESVFTGERGPRATCVASTGPESVESMADAAHIARHDPARVLAECGAKRRIVGMYVGPTEDDEGNLSAIGGYGEAWLDAIRFLALPYADHPDYHEEWKP